MSLSISFEQFMNYKNVNLDMLPELVSFANNLSYNRKHYHKYNKNFKANKKNNWSKRSNIINKEQLVKQNINTVLNKISSDNFDDSVNELFDFINDIDTPDLLTSFIDKIYFKAINETKFSNIYAKLCKKLFKFSIHSDNNKLLFKKLFLNKCQSSFNHYLSINDLDIDDKFSFKLHIIGYMTFISHLYNENILTSNIIKCCITDLINNYNNNCYIIKAIQSIFLTCGSKLFSSNPSFVNSSFDKLDNIKSNISMSHKFTILDILDLKNSW